MNTLWEIIFRVLTFGLFGQKDFQLSEDEEQKIKNIFYSKNPLEEGENFFKN